MPTWTYKDFKHRLELDKKWRTNSNGLDKNRRPITRISDVGLEFEIAQLYFWDVMIWLQK